MNSSNQNDEAGPVAADARFGNTDEVPDFKAIHRPPPATRSQSSALDFSLVQGQLYDRESEKGLLFQSFKRLLDDSESHGRGRELVIISGYSGTGKTALAYTLREHVIQTKGILVAGKFDQLRSPRPFAAFLQAFTQYVDIILNRGDEAVQKAKFQIQQALGSECQLLTDMIPSLEKILGEQHGGAPVPHGPEAQKRFKYVFRLFVRSICQPSDDIQHPVVLLLDDLQWADTGSLKLLDAIITDPDNPRNLLLVGTCRHNEVSVRDEFAGTLRAIEDYGIAINNIQVTNLTRDAVASMVSDLLRMPNEDTKSLSDLVYKQTKGNVVFVLYFLRSLVEEGFLWSDPTTSAWRWKEETLADQRLDGDVVSLVARTIQHLGDGMQEKLKVAACLGAEFSKELLDNALANDIEPVDSFLTTTVEMGLVLYDSKSRRLRFVHDRVQQAAYSLIPEEERDLFHLNLGRTLWKSISQEKVNDWIFVLVSQLSRGLSLVKDQKEKNHIAALFLRAGEQAVLSSAFAISGTYFQMGIDLLGDECWKNEYYLCLALFDGAAEVAYCNGDFELVDRCVEHVLENADSFRDKLRACSTQVYTLGARDRLHEAIDVALEVLRLLSEPFPSSVGTATLLMEIVRTKWVLRGKSDEGLLRLPRMTDPDKSFVMKLLNILFLHAYQARPEYAPLVALRQVRLTMRYGLSPISASGFATYGMTLTVAGDAASGYRYGQLALKIQDEFGAPEYIPRVYAGVFGSLHHWNKPLREGFDGIKRASKMGFLTGDIEYGALEANVYCVNAMDAGVRLTEMEHNLRHNCTIMTSYNQDTELWLARILLQGVLNLKGEATDPLVLSGEVLDESEAIQEMVSKSNVTFLCFIYLMKLWNAYILGEFEQAEKMAILSRNVDKVVFCAFDVSVQCFFDGMTALALAQQSRHTGDLKMARNCLKRMTQWAKHCPANFLHKRYLLEAELAVYQGKHAVAVEKFTSGIALAKEQHFLHEQAIGHERMGVYLLGRGDQSAAAPELAKAVDVFATWGSNAKVTAMKSKFAFLD